MTTSLPRRKRPASAATAAAATHPDAAELRPGQSIALLQELHLLTREGRLNQDARRKLKQIYHLYQFIEPLLQECAAHGHDPAFGPTLADLGAGKSYLGFILYDLYFKPLGRGWVYGIETRPELVEKSRALAQRLGFERMRFLNLPAAASAQAAELPERIDIVTALHACDTATDDAIDFGLQKKARAMVLVPCCQAEVAACLRRDKAQHLARTPLAELWRHPLHTREFGSQLTNVLRCLRLEASGYHVTVTEFVGWEHSLKNELIIARHTGQKKRSAAERLHALLAQFGLDAALGARFGVGE
ncbi:class I SAM-dependent methyltransferase [Extensimonas vulgaris]|uniref:Methyltransferase family protein n=1 Tax=Extensimonas vulgaris TaxID=1031594 RepID=A0A369AP02_9BURK|nr:SAM-dependent methyltransferase [Extensimonas vulgaris]RCX11092.1 methyltransferase family protein [Extensimonas vulgaris]TWI41765.1 methyltransferase family protein [Extensimonas vulgaris]TXD16228.1 SAM-dependent methyltransferase [Extensimonas vulgaris]